MLTDRDRSILEFEAAHPRHGAGKELAIRSELGLAPARFYQLLSRIIRTQEALEYDPVLVNRLRRLAEDRARRRAARSLGSPSPVAHTLPTDSRYASGS